MKKTEQKLDVTKTCYLFFDYDNTVLVNGSLPEEHVRAMEAVQKLGHQLIINTGRAERMFTPHKDSQKIPWDGAIYGASDLRYRGEILEQAFISWEDFYPWLEVCIKNRTELAYCGSKEVVVWNFKARRSELTPEEKECVYKEAEAVFAENPLMKMTYRAPLKECEFPKTTLRAIALPKYVEIFASGWDKGIALLRFCEKLDIPLSQCICFGDSENDMDVFRVCPTGICMKESPKALSELADYHAKTDFGVAEGLEYLFGEMRE